MPLCTSTISINSFLFFSSFFMEFLLFNNKFSAHIVMELESSPFTFNRVDD